MVTQIPLGTNDWRREVALAPDIGLVNRYFERTPDPEHGPVSLIARPGLRKFVEIGDGPIRGTYDEPGTFDDDLFAVSGDNLWRVTGDSLTEDIGAISSGGTGQVSFAATPDLGEPPEFLFLTEGGVLWVYNENGQARGLLQAGGAIANGDTVEIGGVYYEWTTGSVDTGTPDGSSGNPWLLDHSAVIGDAIAVLAKAINDSGVAGTDYSTALTAHPDVEVYNYTSTDIFVAAFELGVSGNTITTTETGANLSWGAGTLEDGGTGLLRQVPTPDDVGMIAVAQIAGYVLCVCAQDFGVNGRYYWIEPGELTIDPLNFATAEKAPDPLYSIRVVGDQWWGIGSSSVEPWYLTGQDAAPFARQQSRVFERGAWRGTDVQVKDTVVIVDRTDGAVYAITGAGPQRISTSSIEERIRAGMVTQIQQGQY